MTPTPQDPERVVLVDAEAAAYTSAPFVHPRATMLTYQIEVSGVTTGATIEIQHKAATDNWIVAHSEVTTAADIEEPIVLAGRFDETRVVISGYTDGTYTVSAGAA